MSKANVIRTTIEPDLKNNVEIILKTLGLSPTEAVRLFFRQIVLRKGLPFEVAIPNETTLQTFEDTDNGKNIIKCTNEQDMFDKLGI